MTNVTISRELLERIAEPYLGRSTKQHMLALQELRAALAAPVQGEVKPVAFMKHDSPIKGHNEFMYYEPWMDDGLSGGWVPLYTTPNSVYVELPEYIGSAGNEGYMDGWNAALDECQDAILAAGANIK